MQSTFVSTAISYVGSPKTSCFSILYMTFFFCRMRPAISFGRIGARQLWQQNGRQMIRLTVRSIDAAKRMNAHGEKRAARRM
jgi:hypothetical protein